MDVFPQLGCVFDPANFIQCNEDILPAFDRMADRITYMHVNDALRESGAVVPAGCVDADFPALSARLRALSDLQGEELVHRYSYPDSTAAFAAAVDAVRGLM